MGLRSAPGTAVGARLVSLGVAVGVAVLAGALLALGGVFPVVEGAVPGYASAPLLVGVALAPAVLALLLLWRQQHAAAAGVLAGPAALAPGSIVLASQFVADPSAASRPALYAPDNLGSPAPGAGLWLLLAGQLVSLGAGVLAVRAVRTEETDSSEGMDARGRRLLLAGLVCAGFAAIGLLMAPFTSTDAYLLARGAMSATGLVSAGTLLVAAALPLAAVLAMGSPLPGFGRGCLAGLGLGVLAACLPDLVAAWSMPELGLSAGPIVAALGAAGLLALACVSPVGRASVPGGPGSQEGDVRVPSQRRLEISTAILAVLSCATAVAGSVTSQVTTKGPLAALHSAEQETRWTLLVAGLLVGVLGVCLLFAPLAARVRPALSVGWVAVIVAGTSVLGAGVAASKVGGFVSPGPGVLWTVLAMILATVTACLCAVTGIVEREDSAASAARGRPVGLLVAGGVLAVPAFALPVAASAEYSAAGLVVNLTTPSWGLLAGLAGVLGAVLVAAYSRTARAAALLAGAAAVLGLRVAQWPLLGARVQGLSPELGWWFALAGAFVLAVATGALAVAARQPDAHGVAAKH